MPTQLGVDQAAIHFFNRRQQGFISHPFPGSPFLKPLGFEDPHPAILISQQSIALSDIEYRHPLTVEAKSHYEAGRLSYSGGYLKPAKRLLVDQAVTKTGLDKALSFANQLFLALEARGHRVVIAPNTERFQRAEVDEREIPEKHNHYNNLWSPQRCTVVYIGTVVVGLTIIELSENVEARYVHGE